MADMPTAEARIATDRPGRYLTQLCSHAAAMGSGRAHRPQHVDPQPSAAGSETEGVIEFAPWGRCTLRVAEGTLIISATADDEDHLRQIQEILDADLARFSHRSPLAVTWTRSQAG